MALSAGTRLGNFEILAPLGAGGMGEVYRARDTKLGREVAIKVLPEAVSQDPEKLARFGREAHLLASLNHPNVATIHGLEESDGQPFLVMELVEGVTLAERLVHGPMLPEEALRLFQHIAEGLEAAHERGIVHRDLKPANIKITPDGTPKILDFGLAKALAGEAVAQDLSQSPTLTRDATETGVLLGTAPYMSPEQARGKPVDKRTDIWAFGCCLYEALTGRAAFLGETVSDTIAAILKNEPEWKALPVTTPIIIRSLLRRSLQKDSTHRLHDIADVRIEIEESLAEPVETAVPGTRPERKTGWALAIFLALIAGVAGWLLRSPKEQADRPVTYFNLRLDPAERLAAPDRTAIALSADGKYLVFVGGDRESTRFYLRPFDRPEARPIPGTEGGVGPFFSPDGEWVGFWANGKLMKASLRGGPAVTLCETPRPFGASWGAKGGIVFSRESGGLLQVSADGGEPTTLTDLDTERGELSHRLPHFLPGGEELLFTVTRAGGWEAKEIQILSVGSGQRKVLIDNGADARYAPTGHLVFARVGVLMAVAFDITRHEVVGGAVGLVDGVSQAVNTNSSLYETGAAQFALSDAGKLAYVPGSIRPDSRNTMVWVDRTGEVEPLKLAPRRLFFPRISPDGTRVAVGIRTEGNDDLWLYDLPRDTLTRLTSGDAAEKCPLWTPDGTRIAFMSGEGVYWMPWDGSGVAERLTTTGHDSAPASWTPDGMTLAFALEKPTDTDVWILPKGGDARPLLQSAFDELSPVFSPDGRWLAYVSDETGRSEVYVQAYPGPGARVQISSDGGLSPVWARNGEELFYRTPLDSDGMTAMMAVDIVTKPEFRAGRPHLLFRNDYRSSFFTHPVRNYDVTPDGQRFLMVRSEDFPPEEVTELRIVLNWDHELKRLVPAGKR
jgi:eukaryotic-like serine/threonine-protein kinase